MLQMYACVHCVSVLQWLVYCIRLMYGYCHTYSLCLVSTVSNLSFIVPVIVLNASIGERIVPLSQVQLLCLDSELILMYQLKSLENIMLKNCVVCTFCTAGFPDSVDNVTVIVAISFISTEQVIHMHAQSGCLVLVKWEHLQTIFYRLDSI